MRSTRLILVPLAMLPLGLIPVLTLAADLTWKDKPTAEWSEDDAKQLLADSAWVKKVTPSMTGGNSSSSSGPGRGNVGFQIPGLGFPGGGGGRRGGTGRPNNGNPNSTANQLPMLTLRWESAFPVREAELKARDTDAPTLEDESHYAIAVYGIPITMLSGDTKRLADDAKKKSALKRDGKKDILPTSVQILRRESGPMVLFLFPRAKEITNDDRRVEFDTQINKLSLTESFYLEDMTFQGKVEL